MRQQQEQERDEAARGGTATAGGGSVFDVVAEPRRRQILDLLRQGERPVNELVEALGMTQPAVSKHLRVLRDAGIVTSRVDAQRRLYRLDAAPLREIDRWITPYRAMWSQALDALERRLDAMPDERPVGAVPEGRPSGAVPEGRPPKAAEPKTVKTKATETKATKKPRRRKP